MKQSPARHRQRLGKHGEDIAVQYLQHQGFLILERNFKARYGEIDIIAVIDNTLIFIEVKTRIGEKYGKPEEAITEWKLREVKLTSEYYRLLHPDLPEHCRIDAVAISLDDGMEMKYINHIQNISQ